MNTQGETNSSRQKLGRDHHAKKQDYHLSHPTTEEKIHAALDLHALDESPTKLPTTHLHLKKFISENGTGSTREHQFDKVGCPQADEKMCLESRQNARWEEIMTSGVNIQNRSLCAAVIHNSMMYFYGGYEITAGILADFHRIDLTQGSKFIWETVPVKNPKNSPGKLCKQSGVVFENKLYLLGGQYMGTMNSNRMFCFDFSTSIWSEVLYKERTTPPAVKFPCLDSHRALVYRNKLIVIGGFLGEFGRYSEKLYSFDFHKKTWSILFDFSEETVQTTASTTSFTPRIGMDIALYQDRIYIFGGFDGTERLNDLSCFDLIQNSWIPVCLQTSSLLPKVSLQLQGQLSGRKPLLNELIIQSIDQTRKGHSLSVYGDYLVLFGGIHDVTWELDDLFIFDIVKGVWTELEEDSARHNLQEDTEAVKRHREYGQEGFGNLTMSHSKHASPARRTNNSRASASLWHIPSPQTEKLKSKVFVCGSKHITDPYFLDSEEFLSNNTSPLKDKLTRASPRKNIESQKRREFFLQKAQMLAGLQVPQEDEKSNNYAKGSSSISPTSEAMRNALLSLGNPTQEGKAAKKVKNTSFGGITYSKFLLPFHGEVRSKVGKKPCARDGHSALSYNGKLFFFGGDRHKMSFHDLFALQLDKCVQIDKQPS